LIRVTPSVAGVSDQRIALVSGAGRGIGREIARQLVEEHGFLVLAGARDKRVAAAVSIAGGFDIGGTFLPTWAVRGSPSFVGQMSRQFSSEGE
jgi:NAD(P)-dependent dehydrogenase (short-subunit alcohol dehydrogenase family)